MVYYIDDELIIRNMEEADARVFTDEEIAQGWHTDISKYLARLQDQSAGKCVSLTAVYQGQLAGKYADTVWLGVVLYSGYGSAQRIYVKRGYIPDGTGVWYQNKPCAQYETEIANDDNLVLFLSKKLKRQDEN
ncbi:MAG: GNAT family N-acetyltransferase [Lachnospiraceae bacterium]|nr:GNAT family N-acetyltransferase [Lachnospiraceae bacterium]